MFGQEGLGSRRCTLTGGGSDSRGGDEAGGVSEAKRVKLRQDAASAICLERLRLTLLFALYSAGRDRRLLLTLAGRQRGAQPVAVGAGGRVARCVRLAVDAAPQRGRAKLCRLWRHVHRGGAVVVALGGWRRVATPPAGHLTGHRMQPLPCADL